MRAYGLDFTSAPSTRKPITCAAAMLADGLLRVEEVTVLTDFGAFERFLAEAGPWGAVLDFPFVQPLRLLAGLAWPLAWSDYVARFGALGDDTARFEAILHDYRAPRPAGDKEHPRATDVGATSCSPMNVANPPVGKLFFRGAGRARGVSRAHRAALDRPALVQERHARQVDGRAQVGARGTGAGTPPRGVA